jgi:hypothetical protein
MSWRTSRRSIRTSATPHTYQVLPRSRRLIVDGSGSGSAYPDSGPTRSTCPTTFAHPGDRSGSRAPRHSPPDYSCPAPQRRDRSAGPTRRYIKAWPTHAAPSGWATHAHIPSHTESKLIPSAWPGARASTLAFAGDPLVEHPRFTAASCGGARSQTPNIGLPASSPNRGMAAPKALWAAHRRARRSAPRRNCRPSARVRRQPRRHHLPKVCCPANPTPDPGPPGGS